MKALIKVGYGCNNHCTFCHTLDVRHVEGERAEIEAEDESSVGNRLEVDGPVARAARLVLRLAHQAGLDEVIAWIRRELLYE